MILKTYPDRHKYGKYFLATEAPDEEEVNETTEKPKRNVKVITVKPNNRRRIDFTGTPDTEPTEDEEPVEQPTEAPEENNQEEDFTADNENQPTDAEPDNTEADTPETTEAPEENNQEEDFTGGDENQPTEDNGENAEANAEEDFTGGNDDGAVEDTGVEAPEENGEEEDFTGGDETQSTEDAPAEDVQPQNTNDAPGIDFDSTRKYNLYREYMSMYNACTNYISKLENTLKDDTDQNQLIRITTINLREIKEILFNYMTIRYTSNTYVQNLLFYQKMVVAIQLVFKIIKSCGDNKSKTIKYKNKFLK